MSANASTFYDDGYRDAEQGNGCHPPDVAVYAAEYLDGYADAHRAPRPAFVFLPANVAPAGDFGDALPGWYALDMAGKHGPFKTENDARRSYFAVWQM